MPQASDCIVRIENANTKEPFEEHRTKTTDNHTECYIVSKTNESFVISLRISDGTRAAFPNAAYSYYVRVDGQLVASRLLGRAGPSYYANGNVNGVLVEPGKEAPFLFGTTSFTGKLQMPRGF
jgi:hypothetical protein